MATTRIIDIIGIASRLSGLPRAQITGKSRMAGTIMVRQAVYLLAHETGCHSTPKIGKMIGGRDHSTVIHGVRAAVEKAKRNPEYAHFIHRIRAEMGVADPYLEGWGEQYEFVMPAPIKDGERAKPKPVPNDDPIYYGGGYSMNRDMVA